MGYKVIKVNGKSKDEHRHMMEKYLGRKLGFDEVVHHINADMKDNRIKNLQIMSRKEHSKFHARIADRVELECFGCSNKIVKRKKYVKNKIKHGQKNFFCSRRCIGKSIGNGRIRNGILSEKETIIKSALINKLSGYAIAKKYGFNKKTVYNIIKRINQR